MPAWMEPYRQYIVNTGGNSVENVMTWSKYPDTNVVINAPLTLICTSVEAQVAMLIQLHDRELLR